MEINFQYNTYRLSTIFRKMNRNRRKAVISIVCRCTKGLCRYLTWPLLENSTVEELEIGWKSTTEIVLPVVDENMKKPSESCDFHSLPLKKRFLSSPNMAVARGCKFRERCSRGWVAVSYVRGVDSFHRFDVCRIVYCHIDDTTCPPPQQPQGQQWQCPCRGPLIVG